MRKKLKVGDNVHIHKDIPLSIFDNYRPIVHAYSDCKSIILNSNDKLVVEQIHDKRTNCVYVTKDGKQYSRPLITCKFNDAIRITAWMPTFELIEEDENK